jgi:predicted SprT family Zn-dependent metalloprotease
MTSQGSGNFDLSTIFNEINQTHFDGFLDAPVLRWNSRLRTSAGRFVPGSRKFLKLVPPAIEIASYLRQETGAVALIRDTVAHEMIHYWLWVRRKPYGHTGEFLRKMRQMGVSRYNPVPKLRPYKYVYSCGSCRREFPARKRLGVLACARCCKEHANGKFDIRFQLVLKGQLNDSLADEASHCLDEGFASSS